MQNFIKTETGDMLVLGSKISWLVLLYNLHSTVQYYFIKNVIMIMNLTTGFLVIFRLVPYLYNAMKSTRIHCMMTFLNFVLSFKLFM
jgi:hypothetical protein